MGLRRAISGSALLESRAAPRTYRLATLMRLCRPRVYRSAALGLRRGAGDSQRKTLGRKKRRAGV